MRLDFATIVVIVGQIVILAAGLAALRTRTGQTWKEAAEAYEAKAERLESEVIVLRARVDELEKRPDMSTIELAIENLTNELHQGLGILGEDFKILMTEHYKAIGMFIGASVGVDVPAEAAKRAPRKKLAERETSE